MSRCVFHQDNAVFLALFHLVNFVAFVGFFVLPLHSLVLDDSGLCFSCSLISFCILCASSCSSYRFLASMFLQLRSMRVSLFFFWFLLSYLLLSLSFTSPSPSARSYSFLLCFLLSALCSHFSSSLSLLFFVSHDHASHCSLSFSSCSSCHAYSLISLLDRVAILGSKAVHQLKTKSATHLYKQMLQYYQSRWPSPQPPTLN